MQIQCTGPPTGSPEHKMAAMLAKRRNEDIRVAIEIKGFANISAGRTLVNDYLTTLSIA